MPGGGLRGRSRRAYFFCDSGYDTRRTANAVVRGLLLQLVQQHPRLIEHVLPKYEERKNRAFDSFDALWGMFLKACADEHTGGKYCVVDALDECEQEEEETLLKQIEETFGRDRSSGGLNINILITSRPYPEIRERMQNFPNKDLSSFDESRQDVNKFIEEKVAHLGVMKKYPPSVTQKVTGMLREKAGGIFLWVGLACQELEKVGARNAVTNLEKIPAGLQLLYKQLLDTALQQDEEPETIELLLGFVVVARRPLSMQELASACGLYQEEDEEERLQFTAEIVGSCRLMVIVQEEKVLLLHQSVRDFLVSNTGGETCFVREPEVHNRLASRCVGSVISKFSSRNQGSSKEDDDFVSYATEFWPEHAHMAEEKFRIEDTQKDFFAIDSKTRDSWWESYPRRYYGDPSSMSIFHVAARWGIPTLVDHALSSRQGRAGGPAHPAPPCRYIDSAYRDSNGRTPLEQCAGSSHIPVLRIMLERADHLAHLEEVVVAAAAQNYDSGAEVMELLLDSKGDQITITEDIIKAAAENEESGAKVMEILLDRRGDQITITEDIIKAAAENWESGVKVMELLLNRRGDQIMITEDIVKAAAENWKSEGEVMRVFLDRRGDQVTITEDTVKSSGD